MCTLASRCSDEFRMPKNPGGPKTKPGFKWWWLLAAIVVVQGAFAVYNPALRGPFLFDDFSLPFYNPLRRTEHFSAWVTTVRPLLMLSYWINYQLSGQQTLWYHIFNVSFHSVNAFLVWRIARNLLTQVKVLDWRREVLSVFAGALFLLHPVQTESVAYVAGRSESLSALFYLLALSIYLSRPPGGIGWKRAGAVLLFFGAAVCTKEHTITLPAVLLLTDMFWARENPMQAIRRNWRLYAPISVVAVLGGLFVVWVLSRAATAGFHISGVPWDRYLLTQFRVIFTYMRLFVLPAGQIWITISHCRP